MPAATGVQVSADGVNWTTIDASAHRTGAAEAPLRVSFSPVEAKFLRLTSEDSGPDGFLSLSEVEVFGPGNTVPGQPEDRTVDQGEPATFTATTPGQPSLRLQWQRSNDAGATFQDISGAIGTTLVVPSRRQPTTATASAQLSFPVKPRFLVFPKRQPFRYTVSLWPYRRILTACTWQCRTTRKAD